MTRDSRLFGTTESSRHSPRSHSQSIAIAERNSSIAPYRSLKHQAIGRRVSHFVTKPDGTLLVAPGQEVTETTWATARRWEMLDDLIGEIEGLSIASSPAIDAEPSNLSTSIANGAIA